MPPYQKIFSHLQQAAFLNNNPIKSKASKTQLKFESLLRGTSLKKKPENILNKSNQKQEFSSIMKRRGSDRNLEELITQGNNEITKIKEFKAEVMETNPLKCTLHNDFISLFCIKDKQILCAECVFKDVEKHKNHTILPIKSAGDIIIKENEKFRKIAKEKLLKLEDSIKSCKSNVSIIEEFYLGLNLELEKEFEEMKIWLEKRRIQAYETLNKTFKSKLGIYETKIKDLEYLKACLLEYRYYEMDEKWDQNTFVYIYNINSMIKNTLDNIDLRFKVLGRNELERPNYQNKGKLKKEMEKFGEINLNLQKLEENATLMNDKSVIEKNSILEKSGLFANNMNNTKSYLMDDKGTFDKKRSETERKMDLKEMEFTKREGAKIKQYVKNGSELFVNLNDFCIQGDILQHFKQKNLKNNC